jgi:hypothetical protein
MLGRKNGLFSRSRIAALVCRKVYGDRIKLDKESLIKVWWYDPGEHLEADNWAVLRGSGPVTIISVMGIFSRGRLPDHLRGLCMYCCGYGSI